MLPNHRIAYVTRFRSSSAGIALAALLCLAWARNASAVAFPGCDTPTDADFNMTTLVSRQAAGLNEPLRMAFDMSDKGDVDIYFVEKAGKVRKYDGVTKSVTNLGNISVRTTGEHGLLGIALDPAFKANRRIYLFYGAGQGAYEFRLSRFTLGASGSLDMGSEKIMLRISADDQQWHTGGALQFDVKGDLWVTVGDNKSDEGGAPNTNSLLGKILRIHPKEDGTYSIPEGNLFAEGTAKTRPEIFIMGDRNPYSIALDPQTGRVAWGEVGPDGFGPTEEFNITSKPGNYGWPYFAGNNMAMKSGKDPKAPVNNGSMNTGLVNLPPAIPATYAYNQSCAITGPVYRYDATPNSPYKMPPQFEGIWFMTDFNAYGNMGGTMDTMSLDANGTPKKFGRIFPKWKLASPTDFEVGPDGALYALNYAGYFSTADNTAIVRIEYKGSCRPDSKYSSALFHAKDANANGGGRLEVQGSLVRVRGLGEADLRVGDFQGRTFLSLHSRGNAEYDLSRAFQERAGLYLVTLVSAGETVSRKAFLGP